MEPQRTKGTARTNLESGRALSRFGLSCVQGGRTSTYQLPPGQCPAIALRDTRKIFRTPQHFVSFSPVIITSLLLLICWLLPCTTSSAASDDRLCHRPPGTANAFDSTHAYTYTETQGVSAWVVDRAASATNAGSLARSSDGSRTQ